jgi:hypothetical protein
MQVLPTRTISAVWKSGGPREGTLQITVAGTLHPKNELVAQVVARRHPSLLPGRPLQPDDWLADGETGVTSKTDTRRPEVDLASYSVCVEVPCGATGVLLREYERHYRQTDTRDVSRVVWVHHLEIGR